MHARMTAVWSNWSGIHTWRPAQSRSPRDVADVQGAVSDARSAGQTLRVVGAGHSFTDAAATDGIMLRLARMSGLESVDSATGQVRVWAGTPLAELNRLLAVRDLAMPNLGDIDQQTIAGAISTGTHGTGAGLGGLATQVVELELVVGDGSVVTCSAAQQPDLLAAASVSLGALGVITRVTLQCVPAFALRAVERSERLGPLLERFDDSAATHDHFEFHWFPHTDRALVKRNDRVPPGAPLEPVARWRRWLDDEFLSNEAFEAVNRLASRQPRLVPPLNRFNARALSDREYVDESCRVFASPRRVRFNECEYAVPRHTVVDVLHELRCWIDGHDERITIPVEVRCTAADDRWLSTAFERDSAYVAVHQYHRMRHAPYFAAFEDIVKSVGGRPHWGKLHRLHWDQLRPLYPRFDDFLGWRDRLDPDRVFANPYTVRVFGR
jgi:L-gulonolactone oxidase